MNGGILFLILFVTLILGIPVYGAIGFTCIIYMISNNIDMYMLVQRMYSGIDKMSLIALPGFIIAGNLMDTGGLAKRLVSFCEMFVTKITGGLAIVSIGASAFFGAISGSSVATTAAIGGLMLPELKKRNYPGGYCASLAAAGGILGGIIPPSIGLVIYGAATGTSITDLFKAGVSVGLFMALSAMVLSYFYSKKHHYVSEPKQYTFKKVVVTTKEALFALGAPVIILGGIFSGLFTPTEAAIVAIIYSLIVCGLVYKELTWKKIWDIISKSAVTSAAILIITAVATLFGWIVAYEKIPQAILGVVTSVTSSKYIVLLMINFFLIIAGMFMNGTSIVLITAPILVPLAASMSINPVHFGIMVMANLSIGNLSPPFGTCLYTGSMISGEPVETVAKHLVPFMLVYIVDILIVMVIPWIALCLV